MIKNYLLVALRNLKKNPAYLFINLTGLTIGLACTFLIFLYLHFEWSYDHIHENRDQLFRVNKHVQFSDEDPFNTTTICPLFSPAVDKKIPGIMGVTRISMASNLVQTINTFDGGVKENEWITYVDPSFFKLFSYPIISGDKNTPFINLDNIVISESMAKKYFGEVDPIGRTIEVEIGKEFRPFIVNAIIGSIPSNTSMKPAIILPLEILYEQMLKIYDDHWGTSFVTTYVMLEEGSDVLEVEASITEMMNNLGVTEFSNNRGTQYFQLQPLKTQHIALTNPRGFLTEADPKSSIILFLIALTILTIACINFTTLSIGRLSSRASEVGVRKVLGAKRWQLIHQFWVEIAIISFVAMMFALVVSELMLPIINSTFRVELNQSFSKNNVAVLLALWGTIVFLAGSYPAFILSNFSPIVAFRGSISVGGKSRLKQGLLFFQFCVSICLISITLVMSKQINYMYNKDLGIKGDQVVSIFVDRKDDTGKTVLERLKRELSGYHGVENIAGSANQFGGNWTEFRWRPDGTYDDEEIKGVYVNTVSYDFLKTLDIELIAGRDFSQQISSDEKTAVIVNEAVIDKFEWEEGVGRSLPGDFSENEVIGVVKNFHFQSLREEVAPLILMLNPGLMISSSFYGYNSQDGIKINRILLNLNGENIPETMNHLKSVWNRVAPEIEFNYQFIDDEIQKMYQDEQKWNRIITFTAMLAITIAILGLFGLSALQVSQRAKEISIRKVLGASIKSVLILLTKEVTLLIIMANLVAWPVAYFISTRWLSSYAYRIEVDPVLLISSGAIALLIALLTVSSLAWRVANSNPINALRDE